MEEEFDDSLEVSPYAENNTSTKLGISDQHEVDWTNQNVYLLVTPKDGIEIVKNTITYSGSGVNETKTGDICTSIPDNISTCANVIKISGSNIYATIYISANTNEGYKNKKVIVRIDKSGAEIVVEVDNTNYTSSDRKISIKTNDGNVGSGIAKVTVEGPKDTETKENQGGEFIFYKDNGEYNITITDNAGNISKQTVEVEKVDKKAPTISAYGTSSSASNTFQGVTYYRSLTRYTNINDPKTTNVEDRSGVAKVLYCIDTSPCEPTISGDEKNPVLSVAITKNTKDNQLICSKAIDAVGNESDIVCDTGSSGNGKTGFIIDSITPTLTVSVNNAEYINTDRPITISLTDGSTSAGIAEFYITDSSGKRTTLNGNSAGNITINRDNGKYTITAKDRAGNIVTKQDVVVSKVDKTLYNLIIYAGGNATVQAGGKTSRNVVIVSGVFGTKINVIATPDHNYKYSWHKVDNVITSPTSTYEYSGSTALSAAGYGTTQLSAMNLTFTIPRKNTTIEFGWELDVVTKYRTRSYYYYYDHKYFTFNHPGGSWVCDNGYRCQNGPTFHLPSSPFCIGMPQPIYECKISEHRYGSWTSWSTTNVCSPSHVCQKATCKADSPSWGCNPA